MVARKRIGRFSLRGRLTRICALVLFLLSLGLSLADAAEFSLLVSPKARQAVTLRPEQAEPTGPFASARRWRQVDLMKPLAQADGVAGGDELVLDLFPDARYRATVDRVSTNVNGTVTRRGRLKGYPMGYVLISTTGEKSLATIKVPELAAEYTILYDAASRGHYLLDQDPAKQDILVEGPAVVPPPPAPQELREIRALQERIAAAAPLADSAVTVNVMIVYTPAARTWADANASGIANSVAQAMAKGQLVTDNSNTLLTVNLVHSAEVNYTENGDTNTDLSRLRLTSDGWLDSVHTLRDTYGADLVVLFEQISDTGGLGYLLNTASGLPAYGFSITRIQQAHNTYTTIHEIGHNMGLGHHKAQTTQPGPGLYSYSAGWRWTGTDNGKYCSVMTYESGTYFADGISHSRVPYFSNPSITDHGVATGDAVNGDNARTIRETKAVVAAYRGGGPVTTSTTTTTVFTTTTTSAVTTAPTTTTTVAGSVSLGTALDNTSLVWTTGGSAPFIGQTAYSYYGGSSARTGTIGNGQSTYLSTTVTGPGTLSFYWAVSSESGYDIFKVFLDGALQFLWSGSGAWYQTLLTIPAGVHTVKWEYVKDSSGSSGQDAGWVDYVVFTPSGVTTVPTTVFTTTTTSAWTTVPTTTTTTVGPTSSTTSTTTVQTTVPGTTTTTTTIPGAFTLAVSKTGSGGGTVTSSAGGISCGFACSASLASGTTVTLTATAASGSSFSGWGGACSGTGNTCTVVMNGAKTVIATFTSSSTATVTSPNAAISSVIVSNSISGGPANYLPATVVGFSATWVTTAASISVNYASLPASPVFYKVINSGEWKQIYPVNQTNGITNVVLNGTALSFTIADNSDCDGNPASGTIYDPIVAGSVAAAGGGTLHFPHVDTKDGWQTEIGVINTSAQQAVSGILTAYGNAGQQVDAQPVTLPARGRRQITVATEFSNAATIGYIVFTADSDTIQGYTKFYREGQYRVAIPAVKRINTANLYVSHIAADAQWWTGISLVNTTATAKELVIIFNTGHTKNVTLAANEHKALDVASLFTGETLPVLQSAVIYSASGVIGLELFATRDGRVMEGILLTDRTATTLYYPHIGTNEWWTGIAAYNPAQQSCGITITPYSDQGAVLSLIPHTIGAQEKYLGAISQLGLPSQTAWFRIDATLPLSGFELIGSNDFEQLAGYAGNGGTGAREGIFAKIEKYGWTTIALVNTEVSPATVTVTAYRDDGTPVAARTFSVAGHAKLTNAAEGLFTTDISSATYIVYTADRNMVGLQLNGSYDWKMLDGLPGLAD